MRKMHLSKKKIWRVSQGWSWSLGDHLEEIPHMNALKARINSYLWLAQEASPVRGESCQV